MSRAVYLFLSASSAVSGDIAQIRDQKRRFSCAQTLWVRGHEDDLRQARRFAEADLADELRLLGYGPSVWESLERLPTYHEDRRHRSLYRAFARMIAADFSWFATAAERFYEADVPVAPVGRQVVVGVEEIATATRRTRAGVLRLIQGGKLRSTRSMESRPAHMRCCAHTVVTARRQSRPDRPSFAASDSPAGGVTLPHLKRKDSAMAAPSRQIYTMAEVIEATGISEDSIRREMRKGLASRFQAGRRRFLRGDVESWFMIGDSAPAATARSFTATRISDDAQELPHAFLRQPSRRAGAA
jgi:hypothetical protein